MRAQKYTLLPSGLTTFLKRRFSQLAGFFMACSAFALAAILWTYHPSDPSWNLAIDGPVKNVLAFPGAIIADGLLQTFGILAACWIVALAGWGVRSMAGLPFRWGFFRVVALIIALVLATVVAAEWQPPKKWLLSTSLGGSLGDILLPYIHQIVGKSTFTYLGIFLLFTPISFSLFLIGVGVSFKQIKNGLVKLLSFISTVFFWLKDKIMQEDCMTHNLCTSSLFKETLDNIESKEPSFAAPLVSRESAFHITEEDREIYAPLVHSKKATSPIVGQQNTSIVQKEEPVEGTETLTSENQNTRFLPASSYDFMENASLGWEDYELPSYDLLDPSLRPSVQVISHEVLEEAAYHLKTVLEEFGVKGDIVGVRPGPVVTMYEFKPAAGIKTSRVIGLADDIARSMSAFSARIAVIPGRNVIGIELPNSTRETVYLRELLQSDAYGRTTTSLSLTLGKDIGGQPVIADLTRMPHLLVAGTTGSGKSVAVNTMILSLLFRLSPEHCKFIMIDPKMLELSVYDGIPHLLSPVVTDPKKAVVALKWTVREMENRYRAMSKLGVRNIDGFNARIREARQTGEILVRRVQTGFDPDSGKPIFENQPLDLEALPYIVVVVDEMADLMMVAGKEIEAAVQRLAQMARAAGIHLIMATQRPSVDVITGTIKANFPTRISFQVTSKIDSRTILGEQGAEQLLGQGDMLYMAGGGRITRVHGPFVRDDEVEKVVAFLKTQAEPNYIEGLTDSEEDDFNATENDTQKNSGSLSLYNQAVELVIREGKASTSFIQRHLQIGYNKAAGIVEQMEKSGIISAANHVGKREVLR